MATKAQLQAAAQEALSAYNATAGTDINFGDNWSTSGNLPKYQTFFNDFLFPKITATWNVNTILGNRFNRFAKEVATVGQLTEEYAILDSIPVNMDLSKDASLMLTRNYPRMATKLYNQGRIRKIKLTFSSLISFNYNTLGDATAFVINVFNKAISDINVFEEAEIKAMLVDYSLHQTKHIKPATTMAELYTNTMLAVRNFQSNSAKYNEVATASGGAVGRYTTTASLDNLMILTTNEVANYILNSQLAIMYHNAGLDLTDHIIDFDDLGGVYKTLADITITDANTVNAFRAMGDYQIAVGDKILAGSVFTWDVTGLVEFTNPASPAPAVIAEIKPATEFYASVWDVRNIRYLRNSQGMHKPPFINSEFDETNHWLTWYSNKIVSPFYDKALIGG